MRKLFTVTDPRGLARDAVKRIAYAIFLLGIFVALGMVVSLPNAAANWSGLVSYAPGTIYVGETTTITFQFTSTGTQGSTNIIYFRVWWDWMTSGTYYDLGSRNAIPDGGSVTFSLALVVPNAVGLHSGTITVNAQATGDWFASTSTYSASMNIDTRPPLTVAVQANPSSGTAPLTVNFYSTVSGGTPGYTYSWTFGDGGTGSSANPSHSYTTAGTFTVTLVVSDGMGRTQSSSTTVTVQAASGNGGGTSGTGGVGASSIDWVPIVAIVIIVAVVIIVVAVVLSRGRRQPPEQPPQPYQPPMPPQT